MQSNKNFASNERINRGINVMVTTVGSAVITVPENGRQLKTTSSQHNIILGRPVSGSTASDSLFFYTANSAPETPETRISRHNPNV